MTSALARAARAVRDEIAHPHGDGEWILDEGFRDDSYFAEVARAVLLAIREPSERMMSDRVIRAHGYAGDIDMVWQAMIDAALAEGA